MLICVEKYQPDFTANKIKVPLMSWDPKCVRLSSLMIRIMTNVLCPESLTANLPFTATSNKSWDPKWLSGNDSKWLPGKRLSAAGMQNVN